jgi:hypothetical protein
MSGALVEWRRTANNKANIMTEGLPSEVSALKRVIKRTDGCRKVFILLRERHSSIRTISPVGTLTKV